MKQWARFAPTFQALRNYLHCKCRRHGWDHSMGAGGETAAQRRHPADTLCGKLARRPCAQVAG